MRPPVMPKTLINVLLKGQSGANMLTAETAWTHAEIRAAMSVKPDEEVEIKTVNSGFKASGKDKIFYYAVNEIIRFQRSEVVFYSISECEPPSDLILPKPGLALS